MKYVESMRNNKKLYETILNSIEPNSNVHDGGSIENLRRKGAEWIMRQVLLPAIPEGTNRRLPDYFSNFAGLGVKAIENAIYVRDGHKCRYCEKKAVLVREIRPRHLGGNSHPRNMIAVCWDCNKELTELLADNIDLAIKRTYRLLDWNDPQTGLGDFE